MKEYLVTASQMKRYDTNTIEKCHIPALVLMERSALVTVEELRRVCGNHPYRVLVVAGGGNNGGDGLAVGRILMLEGCHVTYVLLGDGKKCSPETARQADIVRAYQAQIFSTIQDGEYDIVIDAIFGIGLSRQVEGAHRSAIEWINNSGAYICSVDIPSGIQADTGEVMECAVHADLTVTYGFYKVGHVLYPGAAYAGKLICRQMGIDTYSFMGTEPYWYTHIGTDAMLLPHRRPDGNKGTFGKVLVIAGNRDIAGAAMLAAKSAFRTGAGMVKMVTAIENRAIIQQYVPEAMILSYGAERQGHEDSAGAFYEQRFMEELKEAETWADVILVGPGIGTAQHARELLKFCLSESSLALVIDADGLNILARDKELRQALASRQEMDRTVILTPHIGEFARLYGCSIAQVKKHLTDYPLELSRRLHCTVVCKDARTIVVCPEGKHGYINTTGNSGMATAGSGDVLAGMVSGLLAQGMSGFEAAVAGVCLHGTAGDLAAEKKTEASVMAGDIIDNIPDALLLQCKDKADVNRNPIFENGAKT